MDSAGRSLEAIVGHSADICRLRALIPRIASSHCNVLITGETGTGKERVAQAIHASSARAHRNLVAINCAALPDSLLEGELFGHEKGAFTGAHARFEGRLKHAAGGTLFLDEVGDLSLPSQAKILRALELGEFYRVGSSNVERVDVRVIAATNHDLGELVKAKSFRSDLLYRLSVVRIELPPLRERRMDIPLLFERALQELRERYARPEVVTSQEALNLLMRYDWPGNIRELRNLVERLLIESPNSISCEMLAEFLRVQADEAAPASERDTVLNALLATNWNRTAAAARLSWSRMTLYRKMKKFNLLRNAHLA